MGWRIVIGVIWWYTSEDNYLPESAIVFNISFYSFPHPSRARLQRRWSWRLKRRVLGWPFRTVTSPPLGCRPLTRFVRRRTVPKSIPPSASGSRPIPPQRLVNSFRPSNCKVRSRPNFHDLATKGTIRSFLHTKSGYICMYVHERSQSEYKIARRKRDGNAFSFIVSPHARKKLVVQRPLR
jgi:hypothetical protein